MRIVNLRRLRGPNMYCPYPVSMATVDLQEFTGRETTDIEGFSGRLLDLLPGLAGHHCSGGRPGGLLAKLNRGTFFGHVLEHVTLELSHLIGRDVYFGRTIWAGTPGWFRLILECPPDEWTEDPVAGHLMELGTTVVTDLAQGRMPCTVIEVPGAGTAAVPGPQLLHVAGLYEATRLGASTAELARAARERGIPVRRMSDVSLLQLGHGCNRRLVWAASTSQTSAVGVDIACDKAVTKQVLRTAGIPVPEGVLVHTAEEAGRAFAYLGGPVVVKPLYGNHGRDVFIAATAEEAAAAFGAADRGGGLILVEEYISGIDYRVLVVGGRVVAAELSPAQVTGDGVHDISALVDRVNADPRRGVGHDRPLTKIVLDDAALGHLSRQGLTPASVPGPGQIVRLRHNANLSTGGTSKNVTDSVHPTVARMCSRAAAAIGLDVCGIDLRLADISEPAGTGSAAEGGVIEINASPGLRMHLHPSEGKPCDVAGHILEMLYPAGSGSRVPIVSVTGSNGKTSTVRLIAHLLRRHGLTVGMTTTDGVFIGPDLIHASDATGPRSADIVLGDPAVQAAVLETARGGIVRRGLGYDRADVAVVTNISGDHVGTDGIEAIEDLVEVKSLVAEQISEHGHLVLNADDPRCVSLAQRPRVRERSPVIRYFGLSADTPAVAEHMRSGGVAYLLDGGDLVEAEGAARTTLASSRHVAPCWGGQARFMVANALAAVAAARALGMPATEIREALATFDPSRDNPGRLDVFRAGQIPVVLDYAHNAAALHAVGQFVRAQWGREGVAVLTLPGDRADPLVAESAHAVARVFDRVVVYEDTDLRGRRPGEMTNLVSTGLAQARMGIRCEAAASMAEAVRLGLALAAPADPVLLVYEKLEAAVALLGELGAERDGGRWPGAPTPAGVPAPAGVGDAAPAIEVRARRGR